MRPQGLASDLYAEVDERADDELDAVDAVAVAVHLPDKVVVEPTLHHPLVRGIASRRTISFCTPEDGREPCDREAEVERGEEATGWVLTLMSP